MKRRNRWIRPLEDLADWLVGASRNQPYELAERHDEWQHVQRAVSNLPLSQRVVVVLYYMNDLSLQEISDILDVPIGTVKSRLHYGRNSLRQTLGLQGDALPDFNYERP